MPASVAQERNYYVNEVGSTLSSSTEWDWLGFAATAVGAGAAQGNATAGLATAAAISPQSTRLSGPFKPFAGTRLSSLLAVEARKVLVDYKPAAPGESSYIEIVPSVNLATEDGKLLSYQCFLKVGYYANGQQTWKTQYFNLAGPTPQAPFDPLPTEAEFLSNTSLCLNDILVALKKHLSGDLARAFLDHPPEPGTVLYTRSSGWNGHFAHDVPNGLMYMSRGTAVDVIRTSAMYSYTKK